MKKYKILFLIVAFTLISFNSYAQNLKIGYMDLSKVFDEYQKTKEFDTILEGKHSKYQEERKVKFDKFTEAQAKLTLLKEDERAKAQEELDALKAEILTYDRQQQADLTKERDEKIREVLLEIEKVVSEYAKKENFSMVFNDRVLIYGNETHEITNQILEILNSNFTKKK